MKQLKIGVFGGGRGADIAKNFMMLNCEIVAICDNDAARLKQGATDLGLPEDKCYDNFDDFINVEMDAMILANFFHEHTPYAIKCFERGIHVFSECISNGTMAEGVELIRAFEKSKSIYMLAENYPQMKFNREMKRISSGGTLGKILYAEGEYNHPVSPADAGFLKRYTYFEGHWRNYLPRTYYITHSLGPVMWSTGATPKKVVAFAAFAPASVDAPSASYSGDMVAHVMTQNDDGSIFRITGCGGMGAHHNAYRIAGTKGQIENLRGMGETVMLRYNEWDKPEGMQEINSYIPAWNDKDEELIEKSGHGGGDYLTARMFCDCIRERHQPEHPFDIHSAVAMSSVAILAHRSMLDGGRPYDIPDFHTEEARVQYENDRLTPFPTDDESATLRVCSHTDFAPTKRQIEMYHELIDN